MQFVHFVSLLVYLDFHFHNYEDNADPLNADKMDTIADVTSACKTAVDILNDLLCFDMMESGILELHKQEVAVLPFLYDNIKLFSSQARGNGVDLAVSAGSIDVAMNHSNVACLYAGSWVARYSKERLLELLSNHP